ncbi:MAG TPA: hypothetical protein RMH99_23810 [Sandaracinaceae bacterium LLY-WYZ-13_1]|nr:hypothetical protein [Sandaracinaceae bacterium LLY-WYZ-13_1]
MDSTWRRAAWTVLLSLTLASTAWAQPPAEDEAEDDAEDVEAVDAPPEDEDRSGVDQIRQEPPGPDAVGPGTGTGTGNPPRPPAPASDADTGGAPASRPEHESICDNRQDDDGDGLPDCADADCFETEHCHAGGEQERTNDRCSDWIDNDGDGAVDCEDDDCSRQGITVCQGSWQGRQPAGGGGGNAAGDEIPELQGDQSVEDLIGQAGDADGERNDYLCSDGIDNDDDGRTDCQDFGCRFDPSVTVCSGSPGLRFSVVAGIGASLRFDETPDIDGDGFTEYTDPTGDVRFTRLQVRALGPIPFIENSFFLLNLRVERTPRLTFATFNIPISSAGHYLSINSGSGGLTTWRVTSTSKMPLLDPPFYLFNAFEQGAGAAVEVGGPITDDNSVRFRTFLSGGSGEFNGNVGGRFFRTEDRNFSYAAGAQLHFNLVGQFDRFDTPYMYTPVPMTLALLVGGRFDQRPVERFAAWNVFAVWRFWHLQFRAESNSRYVLDFDGVQTAWNFQASVLLVPRTLMFAADVGGFFVPLEYDPAVLEDIDGFGPNFPEPIEEFQVRAALHWYYYRNIGILSLLYSMRMQCQRVFGDGICQPPSSQPEAAITEHEIRLEAQFRF